MIWGKRNSKEHHIKFTNIKNWPTILINHLWKLEADDNNGYTQTDIQTNRQTDEQRDEQTNRQTERQTDRQTNKQTDKQTDERSNIRERSRVWYLCGRHCGCVDRRAPPTSQWSSLRPAVHCTWRSALWRRTNLHPAVYHSNQPLGKLSQHTLKLDYSAKKVFKNLQHHKKLNCHTEAAPRSVSLKMLVSHSRSLNYTIQNKFLLVFHCNYVSILYRFWDILCRIIMSLKLFWRRVIQGRWEWHRIRLPVGLPLALSCTVFIARQHTDARYWYGKFVCPDCLSVRPLRSGTRWKRFKI